MAILIKKDKKQQQKLKKPNLMKKNKHNFYSGEVKKLMSSSSMLCGSHFCPFSPISQVEQWPQAKRAATYRPYC
jgi:hypothetical protein